MKQIKILDITEKNTINDEAIYRMEINAQTSPEYQLSMMKELSLLGFTFYFTTNANNIEAYKEGDYKEIMHIIEILKFNGWEVQP